MIFDAIEQANSIAAANFTADLTALAAAKSVTVTANCNFVMRQDADFYVSRQLGLPACGIYADPARDTLTQGKDQTKRDNDVALVFDYYAVDTDHVKLGKQVELAAEALLMSIDRLATAGVGGIYGVGEGPGTIRVVLDQIEKRDSTNYGRRARVRFIVNDRDTGL